MHGKINPKTGEVEFHCAGLLLTGKKNCDTLTKKGQGRYMGRDISQIIHGWEDRFLLRNAYKSGATEMVLSDFSQLVLRTFEAIRRANNAYVFPCAVPENSLAILNYLKLISGLSQYAACDCTDDASKDMAFTASCLIAKLLVDYALVPSGSEYTPKGIVFYEAPSTTKGDLGFSRFPNPKTEEEFHAPPVVYNVYNGDFRDVLAFLAAKPSSN